MKERLARLWLSLQEHRRTREVKERLAHLWLSLQERRRRREVAELRANTLIVDDARGMRGEPTTAYWWAYIPPDELETVSPLGHGRYVRQKGKERIFGSFTLLFLTGAGIFIVFSAILFLSPTNTQSIATKVSVAGFWGMAISGFGGGPVVYIFRRRMFSDTVLYVLLRITSETAEGLGLTSVSPDFIGPRTPHVLVWAESNLYATDIAVLANTLIDMQVESTTAIWQMEMLNLGVDAFATKRFIQALTGAKGKEDLLKGRGLPGSVDRNPSDSSTPDIGQVPGNRRR